MIVSSTRIGGFVVVLLSYKYTMWARQWRHMRARRQRYRHSSTRCNLARSCRSGLIVVHAKALNSAHSNVVPFVLPTSKAPSELREENPWKRKLNNQHITQLFMKNHKISPYKFSSTKLGENVCYRFYLASFMSLSL